MSRTSLEWSLFTSPRLATDSPSGGAAAGPAAPAPVAAEEAPIVRSHSVKLKKGKLEYTTTTGFLPIKNDKGETDARFFFTAYTLGSEQGDPKQPLMFSFNGGPGSSSVWL